MGDETAKGRTEQHELSRLQRSFARRAAEAKATMPDFSAAVQLDRAPRDAALVHVVARALRAVPIVNGAYRDGRAERYSRVNVGVALTGPVAPTLLDADTKSVAQIAQELQGLRDREPEAFTAPELGGATFTISGLGVAGIASLAPVLVPRQAAGLGAAGAHLTLVCDARVLGPADAGRFLAQVREALG